MHTPPALPLQKSLPESAPDLPLGCRSLYGPLAPSCAGWITQLRGSHLSGDPLLDRDAAQVCVRYCSNALCEHHSRHNCAPPDPIGQIDQK